MMVWNIPGTVLQIPREQAHHIPDQFASMFFGGGMVLSQVASITGLESYTVQNWVKRGYLTAPVGKRYTLRQFCRIVNINMLRGALSLDSICNLLGYVNGQLNDEKDDIIDDAQLYFMFVRLALRMKELHNPEEQILRLDEILADYKEPYPGATDRVRKALQIMITAWLATRMRQEAERLLCEITESEKGKQL